jgi:aspartyl/asparaginyl beta-hydroxylase (cupin superfamily)
LTAVGRRSTIPRRRPSLFLDPSRFSASRELERSYPLIRAELDRVPAERFLLWPLFGGYQGLWQIFPLQMWQEPPGFIVDYEGNRALCPGTWQRLQDLGCIRTACFSWLDPGTHVVPHTDAYYHRLIRLHLGLRIPPQSLMRSQDEIRSLDEGRVVVLDGQVPHEAANLSTEPRVTLLVDVEMTDAEQDYVLSQSPRRREALERWRRAEFSGELATGMQAVPSSTPPLRAAPG